RRGRHADTRRARRRRRGALPRGRAPTPSLPRVGRPTPRAESRHGVGGMPPSERALESLWAASQAIAKKRWPMWDLDELLAVADAGVLAEHAAMRVSP